QLPWTPGHTYAGGRHLLIARSNTSLESCGDGGSGALGHGDKDDRTSPEAVYLRHLGVVNILDVAAGSDMSFVVADVD
ncbi:unnamed protein product, partial [Sphacelaria rigidula]